MSHQPEWSDIRGSIGAADVAAAECRVDVVENALLDALSKVRQRKADVESREDDQNV